MAHCKMANAKTAINHLKPRLSALYLPSFVQVMLASLSLAVFLSGPVQASDETRVSFSHGYQLNNTDRHTHPSPWWLTPRHNARAYAHPFHHSRWGNRLYPNSSLSITWGTGPFYQNSGFYRQPRWRHWDGFEDNNAFSQWHYNPSAYATDAYPHYAYSNNAYRNNANINNDQVARDEGAYLQGNGLQANTVISRQSTQVSHSTGLTSLPANARVVQQDDGITYEWQGVSYRFDWNSQTYLAIAANSGE
jgi:hypothetical protein